MGGLYGVIGFTSGVLLLFFLAVYGITVGNLLFFNILLIGGGVVIAICSSFIVIVVGMHPELFMSYSWNESKRRKRKKWRG